MKSLLWREIHEEEKEKLTSACNKVIDLLRKKLDLHIWECYFVCKVLLEEFPVEDLFKEEKTLESNY